MTGTKRNAEGNLTPLKNVTKRGKEGSDELDDSMIAKCLERPIIKKDVSKLESFKHSIMVEFCKEYNLDVGGTTVKDIIICLMKRNYIDTDLTMTVDDEEIILSDEVAKFQRGKLEGIFQGKPATAEVMPLDIKKADLDNKDKVGQILNDTLGKQTELVTAVTKDLNSVMKRLSLTEEERVNNILMKCKHELIVSGLNLNETKAKNGFELGNECRKLLREMAEKNVKTDLDKPCNKVSDVVNNEGAVKMGCFDRAEVRALGREAKTDQKLGYKTISVIIKLTSESEKELTKELLKDTPVRVRESMPKNINEQKVLIQMALRELENYKDEKIWIRSDVANVRQNGKPTFKVNIKDTRDPGSKWTIIGHVPVREPSIWARIPIETRKEVIYAEINASGH